jgi:cobalamin-dependent methionine synthase I
MIIDYDIHQLTPYINWDYFFYAWGMHNKPLNERRKLQEEAVSVLSDLEGKYRVHALFLLMDAHSEGDDIVLADGRRIPLLRQQQPGSECLCLADFLHPEHDRIGLFATTVDMGLEKDFDNDTYLKMMVQLLADRLAEAAAECMHEAVRKTYWGYAPDEQLTMQQLHVEKFQGIRPAVGYPSLPDTSLNFVLNEVLDFHQIGIRLTESGAMKPHASVSGLMLAHPEAHYFSLGTIGEDQLQDYACRRGLPVEVIRKFLTSNL